MYRICVRTAKKKSWLWIVLPVLTLLLTGMAGMAASASVDGSARAIDGPVAFTQPETGEWSFRDGHWYFKTAREEVKSRWACIENRQGVRDWYCFDPRGVMCTGWQKSSGGNWYYLRETPDDRQGAMERGFILDASDGRCYYMDPATGVMRSGWVYTEGNAYYFAEWSEGCAWYWDGTEAKWKKSGSGRPFGSMYRSEQTPDGFFVDDQGRRIQ